MGKQVLGERTIIVSGKRVFNKVMKRVLAPDQVGSRHKRTEESLSHERNLYKDLVSSVPAGVYRLRVTAAVEWVDNEWVSRLGSHYSIEMATDIFCQILGITQAERKANATIVAERIHPEDLQDFSEKNVEAIHSLQTFKWEGRILKKGAVRWVRFISVPRSLENGDVLWTGILQDITEQRMAEKALRDSERRYRSLFTQSPDSIVVFDPRTTAILDFNDAACQRLGYTRKEFSSIRISDIDLFENEDAVRNHSRRVIKGGVKVFETRHRTKSGKILEIEVWPKAVDVGGKTLIQAIWRDITDRKRDEERLKKSNEELESKVRERTTRLRLLAAELTQAEYKERRRIAHVLHEDLQQHLVAMQYKVNALKDIHKDDTDSHHVDWLLKELNQTIQISRDLTSRLSPAILYEFGLLAALEKVAADMKLRFGLTVSIGGGRAFLFGSDEIIMFAFESVRELLMNVIKHAGVKVAKVRIRKARNRIIIEVLDKGVGFNAVRNGENKFGLFSIQERAAVFGGNLKVVSQAGKGTCVTLTLPLSV